ncbi:hypothetical protein Trydic_g6779 [Trypoxylus dichotomus]
MEPRKRVMVALLDIEKAYDKVWREGLIFKMGALGLPTPLVKTTQAWLEDRRFRIRVGKERSEQKIAREGLPQGSPLSPILFNIYVNDIPQFHESPGLRTFQFADDRVILAVGSTGERCRDKIEAGLEAIARYADRWNISINYSKTEIVAFGMKTPKERRIRWRNKVGGQQDVLNPKDEDPQFDSHPERHIRGRGVLPGKPQSRTDGQKTQTILARKCAGAPWFIRNEELRLELKLQHLTARAKEESMKTQQAEKNRKRAIICEATPD